MCASGLPVPSRRRRARYRLPFLWSAGQRASIDPDLFAHLAAPRFDHEKSLARAQRNVYVVALEMISARRRVTPGCHGLTGSRVDAARRIFDPATMTSAGST